MNDDRYATITDAVREHTFNVGRDHPDVAWILSPYDTWNRNPYYTGEPVPHPEDMMFLESLADVGEA